MQPGDTVTPGGQQAPPQSEAPPTQQAPAPSSAPDPQQSSSAQPETPWVTNTQESLSTDSAAKQQPSAAVSWTASEYIAHEKSAGWYALLALATAIGSGLLYLVTEDRVTVVMILIVALIFGIFASRKPEVLSYQIDEAGVTIGSKHYPYASFRSFAIQEEGAINSILLVQLQRFMPGISIYFPPEQEQQIVNTLGSYLPHEQRPQDAIDRLMRKVRF